MGGLTVTARAAGVLCKVLGDRGSGAVEGEVEASVGYLLLRQCGCHAGPPSPPPPPPPPPRLCSAAIDGELGEELAFAARCNAAVVTGAEAYYRNM